MTADERSAIRRSHLVTTNPQANRLLARTALPTTSQPSGLDTGFEEINGDGLEADFWPVGRRN